MIFASSSPQKKSSAVVGQASAAARFHMHLEQSEAVRKLWAAARSDVGAGKNARVKSLMAAAGVRPSMRRRGWWSGPGIAGGCYDNGYEDLDLG